MKLTEPQARALVEVGDRVIRASAKTRSGDVLGTVIEARDGLLRVGFEDGHDRWVHPSLLRRLDAPRCPDALAEWEARNG